MAVGCGLTPKLDQRHASQGCARQGSAGKCDIVFTTHMLLGAELSVLPETTITKAAHDVEPSMKMTPTLRYASATAKAETRDRKHVHSNVSKTADKRGGLDTHVWRAFAKSGVPTWASFYSSLPVLRTVVGREPFSYLASVHDWHWLKTDCRVDMEWAEVFARQYMMALCGIDCPVRLAEGLATITQLERQADDNLKQSFAVVGLLNNFSQFESMMRKRFAYTATFGLGKVKGRKHGSKGNSNNSKCKAAFTDASVRALWIERSSAVQMLLRLHRTAVRVNGVQASELQVA